MIHKRRLKGIWYTLVGVCCFGIIGVAQALIIEESMPLSVGSLRVVGGAVALLVWAIATQNIPRMHDWPVIPTSGGCIGLIGFQKTFFLGIEYGGVLGGTVVPMVIVLMSSGLLTKVVYKAYMPWKWVLIIVLAIGGLGAIWSPKLGDTGISEYGWWMIILSGISYTIFLVSANRLLEHHNPESVITMLFSLSAIALLPVVLFFEPLKGLTIGDLLVFLQLAMVTIAIAFTVIVIGLRMNTLMESAMLTVVAPWVATFLSMLFLEMPVTVERIVGLVMVVVSVVLYIKTEL